MRKAVVSICGFRENPLHKGGIERLWAKTLLPMASENFLPLLPLEWKSDPKDVAETLVRLDVQQVMISAYSWGAGWTTIKLAKELQTLGKHAPRIVVACLCDPVYRSPYFPSWWPYFNVFSILPFHKIQVPENIEEVFWCRQFLNVPRSQGLKKNKRTVIHCPSVLDKNHFEIDNSTDWQKTISIVANQFAKE